MLAVWWLWRYSDHSWEDKYIKPEPVSAVALCKAISIANRLSLAGSRVIQSLKGGCFIKVLYSGSTLIQPMWSKTKCIKALWNRAAPKHGSLNDFFTHRYDQMMNCDGLQPDDYLYVITIFSCLFCTFVGNVDKPLSPSSEWFLKFKQHQSKVIQAPIKKKKKKKAHLELLWDSHEAEIFVSVCERK